MNRIELLRVIGIVMFVLVACGPSAATAPPATEAMSPATVAQATATVPPAAEETVEATPATASFPLSEPGPYFPGKRTYSFVDAERSNREVEIIVWYPAIRPDGYTGTVARDAVPDLSAAPYPLILSSAKVGNLFAPHLVSHGFVVAGVDRLDYYVPWDQNLIDQPLDIVFALNQIASDPLEGLEGIINADHAGAMGYSFDGYNALALSGARVDPEYYLAQCAQAPSLEPALDSFWIDYYCTISSNWEQFAAHAGEALATSEDGLWQPMTDERIRAVMPMAPEGAWLFGERGLAAVNRPTLIIGATEDKDCDYHREAVYIFEHLGTPDRAMISFVGQGHMMVFDAEPIARMSHFATAFFGYHLQGRADYAGYFSEDFVAQYDDLAWGVSP